MKIGIMSDIHQDVSYYDIANKTEGVDLRINAGDTHPNRFKSSKFLPHFDVTVMGNHDYYGHNFPNPGEDVGTIVKDGVRVAWATLWTDIGDMEHWMSYVRGLNDSHYISAMTFLRYREKFEADLEYLAKSEADVVVTHHSPFLQSVAPQYADSDLNHAFHSNLDMYVDRFFKVRPKLWVHGHTHTACDYVLPFGTRVVCHPRGYPGERGYDGYRMKVVEI